tara:strand:- start:27785 stop:28270 length:486 start_codon:yes stop_codon:yes gene_type:complete
MNWAFILDFLIEIAYLLLVFGVTLAIAIFKGRQAVINIICGLYLALLISIEFPYYDKVFGTLADSGQVAMAKMAFFIFIAFFATKLFSRIMPDEFSENKFESFGKKSLLALGVTVLVMTFSFHVLPVTEFLSPGTPIQSLFAPAEYFFWWLLAPLVLLYLN